MAVHRKSHHCVSSAVIAAAIWWTLGCPQPALAECLRRHPAGGAGGWCSVDGAHVRVWWNRSSGSPAEEKAIAVRDEVEGYLWPLFEQLFQRTPLSDGDLGLYAPANGGDGRYDIMLMGAGSASSLSGPTSHPYGDSPPVPKIAPAAPTARFSRVRGTLQARELMASTAHELMHGFLTSYHGAGDSETRWLEEATATWAENLAYPMANTEHEYAADFFRNPSRSLMASPGRFDSLTTSLGAFDSRPTSSGPFERPKYGAYLFLFFLQHRNHSTVNGNPDIIRSIWEAVNAQPNPDPVAALNGAIPGGLAGAWRDFMTANWNDVPATALDRGGNVVPIYVAWDRLRDGVSRRKVVGGAGQRGPSLVYDVRATAGATAPIPLDVSLPPLSAAYFTFRFDVSVRTVELRHNLQSLQSAGAEVVVYTRQGDDWTLQPRWGSEDVHTFCRDRSVDRIDEMLVILGNAATTTTLTFARGTTLPSVTASTSSCIDPTNDPDAGFQECEFRFPSATKGGKQYEHLHREAWELVGTGTLSTDGTSTAYQYRWTVVNGKGASVNNIGDNARKWTWTIAGIRSGGRLELKHESGQNQQSADRTMSAPSVAYTVTETRLRDGRTLDLSYTLAEYSWPKRIALRGATRIEGFDVIQWMPMIPPMPSIYQWPGVFHFDNNSTVTCRWSFPAAPAR